MKKLGKLKLNALNEQDLAEKQMNALRGGGNCFCSCYWAGNGGSSELNNRNANYNYGYHSAEGCSQYAMFDNYYSYGLATCSNCDASHPFYVITL
jgi:natural product precursor